MKKSTIRAIIIDDEKLAREMLRGLIEENCPTIDIVAEADTKDTGQVLINTIKPDLIFLDIEMPSGSGFDLLNEIAEINAEVVFTTAFDQYALKAIKISALDYILKPVKKDELIKAIEKFSKKDREITRQVLEIISEQLKPNPAELKRIGISSSKGINIINVADIMYCEADSNYTVFKLLSNDILTASKTLKEYESILPSSFIRTHHKYIVNINHVQKYLKGRGGAVIMKDGKTIDVSQNKKSDVLKAIGISF